MSMPLYASPEQLMRERSELARKGIARGRSVVVLKYRGGVLFVAENPSPTLHKVSEIYDRIGFAAVGRYSEFEALRRGGIRHVDLQGYQYDRRDVSARALANVYAQTLSTIFTEQLKPYEVEICVAQVGANTDEDELYRLTYDGSIGDESRFVVMGGQTEAISTKLKDTFSDGMELADAVRVAAEAFRPSGSGSGSGASGSNGNGSSSAESEPSKLEVAVLERERPGRKFRRITGAALDALLPARTESSESSDSAESSGSADSSENGDSGSGSDSDQS
ncbi:proteasome subunit alpha [Prauserella rugosa]|uniref:Proteasome subunit alpha n=1 Tax=Prauserella rugosa TaxID=43354 RepID=A0A660CE64_9PSEU|nr:proteasome subunit alpha [Prauserella rugosa]KID31432.1 proteasome, alpha subunit, bacterial type [Prauserella sp. Am3]KMS84729.1 proteasome subunit alpha [Streptomyces regensis]TWH19241.1 proteasome alpha subunit [Prauserella rugosa]